MALTKVSDQTRSAISATTITNSTTQTFTDLTRGLYVGTSGDLSVTFGDGITVTLKNAPSGYHPLQIEAIQGTLTTAEDVVALF